MSRCVKQALRVTVLSALFTLPAITAAQASEAPASVTVQTETAQVTGVSAPQDNWAWD
ncbi:hypothetical protein ACFYNL_10250 [Streptomyces sp. NPDC007808]|uniref:hypothetical protein n=1 Tax=Streptomyces sp. NPDC007808 TaxID=3364779 RepID=UPI003695222C